MRYVYAINLEKIYLKYIFKILKILLCINQYNIEYIT